MAHQEDKRVQVATRQLLGAKWKKAERTIAALKHDAEQTDNRDLQLIALRLLVSLQRHTAPQLAASTWADLIKLGGEQCDSSSQYVTDLIDFGTFLMDQNKDAEAEQAFERAIQLAESLNPPDQVLLQTALRWMADLHQSNDSSGSKYEMALIRCLNFWRTANISDTEQLLSQSQDLRDYAELLEARNQEEQANRLHLAAEIGLLVERTRLLGRDLRNDFRKYLLEYWEVHRQKAALHLLPMIHQSEIDAESAKEQWERTKATAASSSLESEIRHEYIGKRLRLANCYRECRDRRSLDVFREVIALDSEDDHIRMQFAFVLSEYSEPDYEKEFAAVVKPFGEDLPSCVILTQALLELRRDNHDKAKDLIFAAFSKNIHLALELFSIPDGDFRLPLVKNSAAEAKFYIYTAQHQWIETEGAWDFLCDQINELADWRKLVPDTAVQMTESPVPFAGLPSMAPLCSAN